ncbi:hypothetical protein FGB62_6g326 [Gracilaria domingensis]|nr:hypothetical protein FGB62_6g326 [Gracilaria domingensis]
MSTESEHSRDEQTNEPSQDWREFRAALIAGSQAALEDTKNKAYRKGHWAHALALPETGCFLASHPAYYRRTAPYLTQAVVFLVSYSRENGAAGLVLNRPLKGTAAELEAVGMFGRSTALSTTALANEPVYAGGPDVGESGIITALHGDVALLNGLSIQQPLYGVYITDALQLVKRVPQTEMSSVRLFAGCIRWKPGELEREVDEGSWFCVSASKLFALEHCLQLPKPLWIEIMECQGHPFAAIANRVLEQELDSGETEA